MPTIDYFSTFISGQIELQEGDIESFGSPILASQQYFIPCSDCRRSTMTAFAYKSSSALSSSGKKHSQDGRSIPNEDSQTQLYQSSPNPARDKVDIRFIIAHKSFIKIGMYNALGQQVGTLVDASLEAGEYVIPFDMQHLPNGVYTYRLTADNKVLVRTMMILK
jgi:hypothetical protein